MPGCKIGDACFVIAQYSDVPAQTVGSFHDVIAQCACHPTWWTIRAVHPCVGHIGQARFLGQTMNLVADIPHHGCHCVPDACLQPIRPGASPVEAPAPAQLLELDHQPS